MLQTTKENSFSAGKLVLHLALSPKPSQKSAPVVHTIQVPKPCESKDSGYDQSNNGSNRECEYPARQKPPPPPTTLPFPATEANHTKLQAYLLDY